ncbi:MAG: hypothetical protein H6740_25355 [Alphaproteobacteria bacterium]|nr:hypothetical protein [Alphaproteobacteria bacterium]
MLSADAPLGSASPLGASLQSALGQVVDPVMALGLVVLIGYWLAGFGGWMAGLQVGKQSAEASTPWASAAVGLAALQLSPALLRGACTGEIGVLGVGLAALALGLTGRSGAVAALGAAAWSWPAGLMALLGAPRDKLRWLLVLPALLLQLAAPPSEAPGALRQAPAEAVEVLAYVSDSGAALPLPVEQPPDPAPPGARQWLRGLHGGVAAWVGGLLALALGPRLLGGAGLALGALVLLAAGPMPPPEDASMTLASWASTLALPGFGDSGLSWAAAGALGGAAGLARLATRVGAGVYVGATLVFFSALVENPRVALPVSNLPPDPGLETLAEVDPGQVLVFPSPAAPWRQAGRSEAEHAWRLRQHGQPLAEPTLAAGLVGRMAAISGAPVALEVGPLLWDARDVELAALREAGLAYLVLDKRSLPPDGKGPLEAWLAEQIGAPLAEGEEYALYTVEKEEEE